MAIPPPTHPPLLQGAGCRSTVAVMVNVVLYYFFLVTRIQFYAIEVARNRRGLNKCHSEKRKAEENQAGDSPAEKAR